MQQNNSISRQNVSSAPMVSVVFVK